MNNLNQQDVVAHNPKKESFKLFSEITVDAAKVQLGGLGPVFRKISVEDGGKVRLGGLGPIFTKMTA